MALFQCRERSGLGVQGQGSSILFPGFFSMLQKMVVKTAAFFTFLVQKSFLFAGRTQPIPECFLSIDISLEQKNTIQALIHLPEKVRPEAGVASNIITHYAGWASTQFPPHPVETTRGTFRTKAFSITSLNNEETSSAFADVTSRRSSSCT